MRKLSCMIIIGVMILICTSCGNNRECVANLNITNIRSTIPKVALTFDDGPSRQYTEKLLEGLKERNVKATFFVLGENIDEHEDIIKRMSDEGHLIGNHTYHHVNLKKTDFNSACEEISKTNEKIEKITGKKMEYIRPPFGEWNEKLLKETDMSVVLWSVDPFDWKDQNTSIVTERILREAKNGAIILLHDIFKTSVEAALNIVDELKRRGFHFVTVDQIESEKIVHGKVSNPVYENDFK